MFIFQECLYNIS